MPSQNVGTAFPKDEGSKMLQDKAVSSGEEHGREVCSIRSSAKDAPLEIDVRHLRTMIESGIGEGHPAISTTVGELEATRLKAARLRFTVDLAEGVARALNITLLEPEQRALRSRPTEDVEAYDYYLRGNEYWHRSWNGCTLRYRLSTRDGKPIRQIERKFDLPADAVVKVLTREEAGDVWRLPGLLADLQVLGPDGAVVGVDIATRSLLWGYVYKSSDASQGQQAPTFFGSPRIFSKSLPPRAVSGAFCTGWFTLICISQVEWGLYAGFPALSL